MKSNKLASKAGIIVLLTIAITILFQNCSKKDSSNSTSSTTTNTNGSLDDEAIVDTPTTPICIEIRTAEEFYKIGANTSSGLRKYCLKSDIDFEHKPTRFKATLSGIDFDGENHKIYGLTLTEKQSIFGNLYNSNIKNLIIGTEATKGSLIVSPNVSGIIAKLLSNTTLKNISIFNPSVALPKVTKNNTCSLGVKLVADSNLSDILFVLDEDVSLNCEHTGVAFTSVYGEKGVLNNVTIRGTGKINIDPVQGFSYLSRSINIPSITNINVDVAQLHLNGITKKETSTVGLLVGQVSREQFFAENISLKGNAELINIDLISGLILSCGSNGDSKTAKFTLKNFDIQSTLSVDNLNNTYIPLNRIGAICVSTHEMNVSLEGTVNTHISLIPSEKSLAPAELSTVGNFYKSSLELNITSASKVEFTVPAASLSKVSAKKFVNTTTTPFVVTGENSQLQVLLNSTPLLN